MSNYFFLLLLLLLLYTISSSANPHEGQDDEPFTSSPGDTVFTLRVPTLDETTLDNLLSFGYYRKNCPQFESILHNKVKEWIQKDYTLAASLLRLHFHDCSVRVCIHTYITINYYLITIYFALQIWVLSEFQI